MEDTDAKWMKNSKKMVYMGHHWFLSMEHPYRNNKKSFYGKIEDRPAPRTLTTKDILTKLNKLKVVLGKGKGSKEFLYVKKINIMGSALLVVLGC